ncbi:hypothetical protein [Nisaea sp.]|uniref:hypothetical protein n=1 Tax=Nisaea sp. TaxID=2024842 RepID=UPI003B529A79
METAEDLYRLVTRLPMRTPPTTSSSLAMTLKYLDAHFRNTLMSDPGIRAFAAIASELLEDNELVAAVEKLPNAPEETRDQARLDFLNENIARLGGTVGQPFMERYFARLYRDVNENAAAAFATVVSAARSVAGTRGTVVMVAGTCYNVIWREAWALKRQGFRTFLVCLEPIADDKIASYSGAFDHVFHGCDNYVTLDIVLRHLDPDVFHVQCRMWEYVMARFVLERKRKAKVICEFYDITGIVSTREAYYTNWSPQAVDLELDCEREIFQKSDGIVHRFPTDLIAEHGKQYGRVPPQAEIQQYPLSHLIQSRPSKSESPDQIRCVYIGNIVPRNDRHPPGFYPNWGSAEAWEPLLQAGIDVSIYYTPHGQANIPGFEFIEYLQERYPRFKIEPTLPPSELAAGIAGYDFGLIVNDLNIENSFCRHELYKGGVGTKLFHYLEAGLPVLINSEYEYASSIIVGNGMGIAVSSKELDTLPQKLREADRAGMRRNVARFVAENQMEQKIHRLVELYELAG